MTKVLIASDHAGFELKKFLVQALTTAGYQTYDLGPFNYNEDDDYPLFVKTTVAKFFTDPTNTTGILICRNGVGVCAIANKYKGVRCALSWNPVHAESAKNDDNANFLALGADYLDPAQAYAICQRFLQTSFSASARHIRRLVQYANLVSTYDNSGHL